MDKVTISAETFNEMKRRFDAHDDLAAALKGARKVIEAEQERRGAEDKEYVLYQRCAPAIEKIDAALAKAQA